MLLLLVIGWRCHALRYVASHAPAWQPTQQPQSYYPYSSQVGYRSIGNSNYGSLDQSKRVAYFEQEATNLKAGDPGAPLGLMNLRGECWLIVATQFVLALPYSKELINSIQVGLFRDALMHIIDAKKGGKAFWYLDELRNSMEGSFRDSYGGDAVAALEYLLSKIPSLTQNARIIDLRPWYSSYNYGAHYLFDQVAPSLGTALPLNLIVYIHMDTVSPVTLPLEIALSRPGQQKSNYRLLSTIAVVFNNPQPHAVIYVRVRGSSLNSDSWYYVDNHKSSRVSVTDGITAYATAASYQLVRAT